MRRLIALLLLTGLLGGVACRQDSSPAVADPVVTGPALIMFYTDG